MRFLRTVAPNSMCTCAVKQQLGLAKAAEDIER
jgi:hypothetical protein